MDIFNKIGDTIFSTGKDVSQKAKDLSGIAKLKLDIKMKEDFIEKQYAQIGKKYFEEHKNDEVLEFEEIQIIEEALESIQKMQVQILDLKGGVKCSKCGAFSDEKAEFCSNCGAHLNSNVSKDVDLQDVSKKEPEKEHEELFDEEIDFTKQKDETIS